MLEERTLISFDWALKSILRQKDNFDILEGFLSDLLRDNIKIIELLESESNKDNERDKFNRVDLKAKDGTGRELLIEVQYDKELDYLERIYYGTSKSLVDSMKEGYKYKNIKKIISISIVYFGFLKDGYIARGKMKFDNLHGEEVSVMGEDVFAEYYFIQPKWFDDNIKDKLDEWVYMFKYSKVRDGAVATNIEKAADKLDKLKMTLQEKRDYDSYQLNKTINESVLQVKLEEGLEKGRKEGKKEGRKEGKEEERKNMIEAMKKSGMSDIQIKEIIKNIN